MTRIGFKTFIYSFIFTLSAVIGVDRAFFYTPQPVKDDVQIPRKNIALFFHPAKPLSYPLRTEPIQQEPLKAPKPQPKEMKVASEVISSPPVAVVETVSAVESDIPLAIEKIPEADIVVENNEIPDMPLVYSGDFDPDIEDAAEKKAENKENTEQQIAEESVSEKMLQVADNRPVVLDAHSGPITIKGTRQVFRIDNLKKYQERKKQEKLKQEEQPDNQVALDTEAEIPILGEVRREEKADEPKNSQLASLGEIVSLPEAEEEAAADVPQEKRQWQTMAEKHKNENPWLVARGSKFVKNKKLLEEGFSSQAAQQKAEKLIVKSDDKKVKSAKIAVQDNLLIPIPQEILDEDDLVPDVSNDEPYQQSALKKKSKPKKIKQKKEPSLLDSISSVFSKENREKAIKKLKAKSNNLLKKTKEEKDEKEEKTLILPTEIRLSFQPNRAEISGQTLRWIQAFAKKVVDDEDVGLEIRIDGSKSFALQQKRLNMLYNILTANGVEYQKINTAFVDREPNSFVVRTVKIVNAKAEQKENDGWKKYYQKW